MSPENIHKLMWFYTEVLILGVILQYMVSALKAVSYRVYRVNPIHPIGNSFKKQKPCTNVYRLVLNLHIKFHKLMDILWAHTGAVGCIGLKYLMFVFHVELNVLVISDMRRCLLVYLKSTKTGLVFKELKYKNRVGVQRVKVQNRLGVQKVKVQKQAWCSES